MTADDTGRGGERASADAADGVTRRPYSRPQLIEYGSVARLTQGTRTKQGDAPAAGFRMTCL